MVTGGDASATGSAADGGRGRDGADWRSAASGGPLHRPCRPRRGCSPPDGAPAEEEADGVTAAAAGATCAAWIIGDFAKTMSYPPSRQLCFDGVSLKARCQPRLLKK
jgi:hypothetical protein